MRKFLIGCLGAFIHCCAYSFVVTDDIGNVISSQKSATRIISLAPDITEILFAIGAKENIKGVISGSNYPADAKELPIVGAYNGLALEAIVRLHPDLIIVWNNTFARQLNVLKKLNIPIYVTNPSKLEDIARSMKNFGEITGKQKTSHELANDFLTELEKLKVTYQNQQSLKIYYQIGGYGLLTINRQSWINQAINLCGGQNIFADAKIITPAITWEALIRTNPQIILSDTSLTNLKTLFNKWTVITAVKNHQLYSIDADYIDRAGPRLIKGVKQICSAIDQARLVYQ